MINLMKKNILLVFLLSAVSATAQTSLSLEEAIGTALKNNYDIQLSKNDSMVAALDYSYRNAVFYPRLNGTLGTTWNNNDQKQTLADGTKREQNNIKSHNLNAALNLNWTLFDGMKMFATRDKAAELIKLGELGIKNQVINTVATVINTYYNIVRQKQQLKAIEEQMSISQTRVNLAERRLDIGVGTKPDVLQSKVDLNAQKAAQLEQQTLISQLREQLNQVMNVKEQANYEVADSIPLNTQLALGDIQNGIEASNPTLLISKKNLDIAGITLKERKAEKLPTVAFNSVYNFTRTNNQTVINPFSPLFNQSKGLNYGVTASIPILNNLTNKRQIQQAKLDIQYQQIIFNNQQSQLNLAVVNAFKEYEQQKKALKLEEENILLAKENVYIALEVYRLGASTIIQLREAQKSLEDAYNRLIAARYNTKLSETELLRLKGDLVK
ncbi:MAG: TolC family protein [Chitinophagaceae bacterium]|nr:TolC family protein [Chitinophagaceae bacterium]